MFTKNKGRERERGPEGLATLNSGMGCLFLFLGKKKLEQAASHVSEQRHTASIFTLGNGSGRLYVLQMSFSVVSLKKGCKCVCVTDFSLRSWPFGHLTEQTLQTPQTTYCSSDGVCRPLEEEIDTFCHLLLACVGFRTF